MVRRPLFALALTGALALSGGPAAAQSDDKSVDELAREGIGKIVAALEMLLLTIPTYEAPEILPNGDIIIRRKNPLTPEEPAPRGDNDDRIDALDDGKAI
ncbi:MAG: hypothetical protein NXI21_07435 [Alphaproteobacteria bacterium]|nr:hypothetical protein [Alphaproteobacteria bacterium]